MLWRSGTAAAIDGSQANRHSRGRVVEGLVDDAGVAGGGARVGVAEHVLHRPKVLGVLVGQRGTRMPQRVVGEPRPLEVQPPQVAVDDLAHPAAAKAFSSSAIADGGHERKTERVGEDLAARLEVGAHGLGDVLAQVDHPVVALAAHQQRPLLLTTVLARVISTVRSTCRLISASSALSRRS